MNDESKVILIDVLDKQSLIRETIQAMSTCEPGAIPQPSEVSMLIEMNGVSIGAEPRKDGRFQGYILLESGRQYFYGESKQAVAQQIVKALRDPQTTKKRRKTKRKETLNEWLDTWIQLYKQPNLKPSSLATLRYALLPARNAFGTRALDSITADELQTFLLGMDRPRSRDECRNALAAAYRKAVALGKIRLSPTDALEIKRHKRAHQIGRAHV